MSPRSVSQDSCGDWIQPSVLRTRRRRSSSDFVARGDGAADGGVVAFDVLRGREQRDVGAELERTLQDRSQERVVDGELHTGSVGDVGDGGDVGELERGIRRRLDEDEARVGANRLGDRGGVGGVNEGSFDAEVFQHLLEEADRAAVDDVGDDNVIAGLQDRQEERGDGGHAGGEADGRRRVFQSAEGGFERGDGRIRGARIGKALVHADGLLVIGGGLIDGREDRAGCGIGGEAAADRGCRELLRCE